MFRIAIFIDGGYLDGILQNEFNWTKVDFAGLASKITTMIHPTSADLLRAYYYHCLPYQSSPPSEEERRRFSSMQNLFAAINRLPRFEVKKGRLARRGPGKKGKYYFEQKMVDTLLSIDLVQLSVKRGITHAVIIAGDSDFVPAVEVAKNESLSVWLFHGSRPHNLLLDAADERIRIDRAFIDSVLWNKKQ